MSFIKVWIHAVWGTKNREPVLHKEAGVILFDHIRMHTLEKELYINYINGYTEHVHCLFELHAEISLAKTMQLLKGESSFWANKNKLFPAKLDWSNVYFAASVSESVLPKVKDYIHRQEEHHQKLTFAEEYRLFLEKHKLRKDKQRHP